jgi:hypothetical protein
MNLPLLFIVATIAAAQCYAEDQGSAQETQAWVLG